ncbi:helix-turn-helix domain-containing protein [Streptomyces fradiae]|uniref:nSTAND1 domain-containing NTPase n=1 Tax=Streptomyces fradiae TaxID=1906 RepID=UPI0036C70A91
MTNPQHGHAADHRSSDDQDAHGAETFPAHLRRLRRERGLSLADLARRTHYSKGYLSKIETGAKRPTADVARLCDEVLRARGGLLRRMAPPTGPSPAPGRHAAATAPRDRNDVCPYRGFQAFTPEDSQWFFGRDRVTAALVERTFERIGRGPLALVAPSGTGKTSLLNAGLVPALKRGELPMPGADRWPVVTLTPTSRPLDELLERTAKTVGWDPGVTTEALREDPAVLLHGVGDPRDVASGSPTGGTPPPARPVLIVDQFEELFTLCSEEEQRRAFVRVLLTLAGTPPAHDAPEPAVVVLGIRADFTDDCLRFPDLAEALAGGVFVPPPMSVAELTEAITRPAELAGLTLEPGLVPLLLRDAGPGDTPLPEDPAAAHHTGTGPNPQAWAGSAPGAGEAPGFALPFVSHALLATWRRREGPALTVRAYERTGGVREAVARTAENVFAGLRPAEQKAARLLLTRLVHVAEGVRTTRRRVGRAALTEQLAGTAGAAVAWEALVRARLVTVGGDTVEISHEALPHAWPRLRAWLDTDRAALLLLQELSRAAAVWRREGRDPSALYRGSRLEAASALAAGPGGGRLLSALEEEFLTAGREREDLLRARARWRVRVRRSLLAALRLPPALAATAHRLAHRLVQRRRARRRRRASGHGRSPGGSTDPVPRLPLRPADRPTTTCTTTGWERHPFPPRVRRISTPHSAGRLEPDGTTTSGEPRSSTRRPGVDRDVGVSHGRTRPWRLSTTAAHTPLAIWPMPLQPLTMPLPIQAL